MVVTDGKGRAAPVLASIARMTTSTAHVIPTTRMVTLLRRPGAGGPVPEDFAVEDRPFPALQPGQLLLRNIVMSVDPSMRGRLETSEKHYTTNFEIGQPLDGSAIGEVIDAEATGDRTGTVVRHRPGWREHAVVDAAAVSVVDADAAPVGAGWASSARPVSRRGSASTESRS